MQEQIALQISEKRKVYEIIKELDIDDAINAASLLIDQTYEQSLFAEEVNFLVNRVEPIVNFDFTNFKDNDYEDYRNLIIMMSSDYRVIVLCLAYRLNFMRKYKKLDINNKFHIGHTSLLIYAPLAHRLGLATIKTELEDLSLYYMNEIKYKEIAQLIKLKKHERDDILENTIAKIKSIIPKDYNNIKVSGRNKSIYSIYNKLKTKGIEELYDLQGIRVICNDIGECYAILGFIHGQYLPIPGRFKDYIAVKKPNLYQSLHSTIFVGNTMVEIQIRTYEMDEIAEHGIAAHFHYKEGGNYDIKDIQEQIHIFRDVINNTGTLKEEHACLFETSIYTFTPNGKIISLPKNASVIDFAYRIHSNVAESMVSAIVNGIIRPIDSELKNGDVVSINTRKNIKTCNKEWLEHAKTAHAKRKIKAFLRSKYNSENVHKIENGKHILSELEKRKLIPEMNNHNLTKLQKALGLNSYHDLYIAINDKKLSVIQINNILKANEKKLVTREIKVDNLEEIIIKGAKGIKKEIAKCCMPIPGDDIIGVINSGKNIKIHQCNCHNISNNNNVMEAFWNEETSETYLTRLEIHALSSYDLLTNIATIFSKEKITIQKVKSQTIKDQTVTSIIFGIKSNTDLEYLINKIEQLEEILYIVR